jgi:hypothetical protein
LARLQFSAEAVRLENAFNFGNTSIHLTTLIIVSIVVVAVVPSSAAVVLKSINI